MTATGRRLRPRVPPAVVAAGLYAAFAVALFWPVLSGERVFSAAADLYGWVPWLSSAPHDLRAYDNPLLSDHTRSFYPWAMWAREQIRAGHLPQWNPYVLSGTPFLSNAQTQVLSPFSIPIWLLPFPYGLGVAAAVKLWVAALGSYLLCRELRLRFMPSLLGGLAFGFCPYLIVWLSHPVTPEGAMLPWMLLAVERLLRRGRLTGAGVLAIVAAVLFLAGYPEGQLHVCLATAVYTALRLCAGAASGRRAAARRAGLVIGGIVLGAALAAVAILPFVLALAGTAGLNTRNGETIEPLRSLITVAFPNWWGRPSGYAIGGAPGNYNMVNMDAGTVALLLAAVAVCSRGGWRTKLAPAGLAALGVASFLGMPPLPFIYTHLPGFDRSRNQLLIVLFDLGVAVLAAHGLERVLDRSRSRWPVVGVTAAGVAVAIAVILAAVQTAAPAGSTLHHFLTGAAEPDPAINRLIASAWWVLLVIGFVVVATLRRKVPPAATALVLVALVAVDAAHFFDRYQPMPPPARVFPSTPAIRYLQAHQGEWRIAALAPAMPADTGMVYGLRDIRGLDPPQPSDAYARLIRLGIPHPLIESNTNIDRLTPARMHVLDLLGVRYLLASRGAPLGLLPNLAPAYRGGDGQIVRNRAAVPPASVPRRVLVTANDRAARAAIGSASFVPGRDVTVARPVPAGRGRARLIGDGSGGAIVVATMSRPGLVVLSDAWAPGWSVTVDGRAAAPVRVDTAIRGVVVPRGRHRIVWAYTAPGFRLGLLVTVIGCVLLMAIGGWWLFERRRTRLHPAAGV